PPHLLVAAALGRPALPAAGQCQVTGLVLGCRSPVRQRLLIRPLKLARVAAGAERHHEPLRRHDDALATLGASRHLHERVRVVRVPIVELAVADGAGDQELSESVKRPTLRLTDETGDSEPDAVVTGTVGALPVVAVDHG